ncbi:MAG: hypothetical protein HUU50_04205 [Candidatus Brocadiae bacterium]|nr:hypothetical protein [Candidatus Brocadiia bacterium]
MQKLHAFYSHGENLGIENTDYLIQTLTPVRKISVSLWSNEIKEQGIEYIYSGEERKKDIKKACEKLIFKADYRPFSSGFLWDDYRGARVKMEGFSNLKNIKIIITFQEGYNIFGKSGKSFYWDVQEWEDQKIKTFATKKLDFDPSSFDIKISFSDTDYVYDVGIFRVNNK